MMPGANSPACTRRVHSRLGLSRSTAAETQRQPWYAAKSGKHHTHPADDDANEGKGFGIDGDYCPAVGCNIEEGARHGLNQCNTCKQVSGFICIHPEAGSQVQAGGSQVIWHRLVTVLKERGASASPVRGRQTSTSAAAASASINML